MTTFVALGDSITLGVGDPVPPGGPGTRRWRGWAELLAGSLPEPDLRVLAASGACAADVRRTQVPLALDARPQIASVIVGINDLLRPGFDPASFSAAMQDVIGSLRQQGAEVLTLRLPAAGRMLGLPAVLARPLAARTEQVNAVMDAAALRFGTLHFDAAADPSAYDRQMWAADRLHPNERGHRHIARRFHDLLAAAGHPVLDPPGAEPASPPPSRLAEAGWLATKGTGWVLRRSTDLVPHLLALAARELIGGGRPHGVGTGAVHAQGIGAGNDRPPSGLADETSLIEISRSRHRRPAE